MKRIVIIGLIVCSFLNIKAQELLTIFEKSKGRQTPEYAEIIEYYKLLDARSKNIILKQMGPTDAGFPLHVVLYSNDGRFNVQQWHLTNKVVILINNGIHPGEPDGIDASMLLLRDIVTKKKKIPDNVVLAVIPVYNIGGCLNRSPFYRVDQDGPEAFGARGNSQNLDLNRDFIKADSKEARSFAKLFQYINPDVFVDNHVSNGADYQHIITLICSQHNKLGGALGEFMNKKFEPGLYALMKQRGYDLIPYVNAFGDTPENGWPEFFEGPRYSSGYASLWNSFAFVPETHMLKPYQQRVEATYKLMESFIDFSHNNADSIKYLRRKAFEDNRLATSFAITWKLNKEKFTEREFKGFEAGRKLSDISGLLRLYYDHNKPFTKKIKFYNEYEVAKKVIAPAAYIVPQGWWKVIERLQDNNIQMRTLQKDTLIEVEVYKIADYKTAPRPFEMHHINSNVSVTTVKQLVKCRKGDLLIPVNQPASRFIVEVLEPEAEDSYFAWNFFDGILGQKEGYSNYVFEDTGEQYLKQQPALRQQLEQKKATDTVFAKSALQQLDFIFKNSPYFEPDYLKYPVYRILK
jgi:Zinc carboxypeptidase